MMDFCCQIVATRESDRLETLISCGLPDFSLYSHSMHSNAFSLIFVSHVRSRDSDSTDYLYFPCSTASVYHFFISVIKRLFCCGLRGLFPGIIILQFCLPGKKHLVIRRMASFPSVPQILTNLRFWGTAFASHSAVSLIRRPSYRSPACNYRSSSVI